MLNLTVPADSRYVTIVRALAGTLLENLGVEPEDIYDVSLVLGEACSNVVRHAYASHRETYSVELELTQTGIAITVTDHGRGIDPTHVRPPDPQRPNGWGIWLVQHIADQVSVTSVSPSGTRVRAEIVLRYRDRACASDAQALARALDPAAPPRPPRRRREPDPPADGENDEREPAGQRADAGP
jgi:serine/threonine-protein kinase RsbW